MKKTILAKAQDAELVKYGPQQYAIVQSKVIGRARVRNAITAVYRDVSSALDAFNSMPALHRVHC